tara:strand:- start:1702 stop:2082 length:381 start_codon:yes stop_codon:yes gene_type:complete
MDIRQFKLANDEEIICEVVEWNNEEDDTMIVRKALQIVAIDDASVSMRYYSFKPWMLMNHDPEVVQIVNSYHIIAESQPAKVTIEHYHEVLKELADDPFEYDLFSGDTTSDIQDFMHHNDSAEILH